MYSGMYGSDCAKEIPNKGGTAEGSNKSRHREGDNLLSGTGSLGPKMQETRLDARN